MTLPIKIPCSSRKFWPTVATFLALTVAFALYVYAEKQIDLANQQRHTSYLLANQLRQSSDDLTRMARTYVVTGDPRFKKYYREVLDIRDGKIPRPDGYANVYWDLVFAGAPALRSRGGRAMPLLELMRQAGIPDDEMQQLAAAKINSDNLAAIEFEAMRLTEGVGPGAEGRRARALRMLHGDDYHKVKAAIMRPFNKYFELMDKRTDDRVKETARNALVFRGVFIVCILGALFMLWRTYRGLCTTLGGSAEEVRTHILRIGQGDFSGDIKCDPGDGESVLAGLSAMQNRLKSNTEELHKAEAKLRAGAERLNEAQHIAQVGSWTLYFDSGKLFWSDEVFRLFEIEPGGFAATYEAFLDVIHPEDRGAANETFMKSLRARIPYEMEHRLLLRDGRVKWMFEKGTSEFDADGKPLLFHGTVQDITERVQAEEKLRIAATAFESQEGMIVTDADSVILSVNRAFTALTGYTQEDVAGKTPRLFKTDRYPAEFYKGMWESILSTGSWQGEIWDRHKDGTEYQKWLTISAVKDNNDTVTHYIGAQYDISAQKKAEERILELAFYDQLTGLPNRTLMLDRLRQTNSAISRNGSHGALLFIDLDNFKTLNDTLGHDMGDLLLKQVAERLAASVRGEDTTARLGGDEFVIMLSNLSMAEVDAAAQTKTVGEKIIDVFNQPYQLRDIEYHITASIGATLFKGNQTEIDALLKQADLAMYRAKDAGRNTLSFFDPFMEIDVIRRVALERDLRDAIQKKQFLLYYQAQMAGGVLTGSEALVRWQHPERGLVSPTEFIPLAEETGLIVPLGSWVLETACAQLALWQHKRETAHLTVSVNVSANQFHQPNFVSQVLDVLKTTGANPRQLKLELTESLFVANPEEIGEKMFALKAKGVGFSLDDFGTGYSSLSYLKRLPLDQLKIDQSFVRDILVDPNDAAIARTIIALAQSLGLGVIAEGVETETQRDFLADSGCHAYQGYLFSRPLPIHEFELFARRFGSS